uniref:Reverse transcriptase domain-containing protein n=1 Tax=Panagrolaimus superbus TaxID=310955 RepID=A0A914Z562_9BILA
MRRNWCEWEDWWLLKAIDSTPEGGTKSETVRLFRQYAGANLVSGRTDGGVVKRISSLSLINGASRKRTHEMASVDISEEEERFKAVEDQVQRCIQDIKIVLESKECKSFWRKGLSRVRGQKKVLEIVLKAIHRIITDESVRFEAIGEINKLCYAAASVAIKMSRKPSELSDWEVKNKEALESNRVLKQHVQMLIQRSSNKKRISSSDELRLTKDERSILRKLRSIKGKEYYTLQDWSNFADHREKELVEFSKIQIKSKNRLHSRHKSAKTILDKPCTEVPFDKEEFRMCWEASLKKTKPLKAPGPDGIPAYWWKTFELLEIRMRVALEGIASGEKRPPNWFCQGRVVLLYKKGDANDPGNYRPISCLNTCYKVLTGALTISLLSHCYKEKILNQEQRALRKGEWACFVSHVIDKVVKQALMNRKESYSVLWIDCKKAYDSLGHKYLKEVLGKIGIPQWMYNSISNIMSKWSLRYTMGTTVSQSLNVLNGVLQGDVLAPLLFCIGLVPVSHALRKLIPVIKLKGSVPDDVYSGWLNHLFYMDDLIAYSLSSAVDDTFGIIKDCLGAAGLEVNLTKCAVLSRNRDGNLELPELSLDETYRYLGNEDEWVTDEAKSSEIAAVACQVKMREIWLSDMSAKQMRIAHNSCIVPKIGYLYSTLATAKNAYNVSHKRAEDLDMSLVRLLKENCIMNHSGNVNRLFLPIKMGGLGIRSVADHLDVQAVRKALYMDFMPGMENMSDRLKQIALTKKQKRIY